MRLVTEKVFQRLAYEKLLPAGKIQPLRRRITLADFLDAAQEEPRIHSALAAILLYKPKIFEGLSRDLKKHPEIQSFIDTLFLGKKGKLFGQDKAFYQKSARSFKKRQEKTKAGQKSRSLLIRLSDTEYAGLQRLTQELGTGNVSATLRRLAEEKLKKLEKNRGPGASA